jgi:hypothetical protein
VTDLETSIEVAERVCARYREGVAQFRAMNATEEAHVLRALMFYMRLAETMPGLIKQNEELLGMVTAANERATDGITI